MVSALPRVTADRICCPSCRQPAPFLPSGLTDWHTTPAGAVCGDVFPPYVVARDPHTATRRPVAHPLRSKR